MHGGTKSISLGLLILPSPPLSLGLGPRCLSRPNKADREATVGHQQGSNYLAVAVWQALEETPAG